RLRGGRLGRGRLGLGRGAAGWSVRAGRGRTWCSCRRGWLLLSLLLGLGLGRGLRLRAGLLLGDGLGLHLIVRGRRVSGALDTVLLEDDGKVRRLVSHGSTLSGVRGRVFMKTGRDGPRPSRPVVFGRLIPRAPERPRPAGRLRRG